VPSLSLHDLRALLQHIREQATHSQLNETPHTNGPNLENTATPSPQPIGPPAPTAALPNATECVTDSNHRPDESATPDHSTTIASEVPISSANAAYPQHLHDPPKTTAPP
jgi:hypothetical protein